jgi:hypothetical protein
VDAGVGYEAKVGANVGDDDLNLGVDVGLIEGAKVKNKVLIKPGTRGVIDLDFELGAGLGGQLAVKGKVPIPVTPMGVVKVVPKVLNLANEVNNLPQKLAFGLIRKIFD